MKLDGARVLVTGAGSGIGRATANHLFALGSNLVLADRDAVGLAETAERLSNVRTLTLDLTDRATVRALPQEVGAVDVLVNNAGIAAEASFLEKGEETFDHVMDVNFRSVVDMCRAFLPGMLERGRPARIVNVSSLWGILAPPLLTAYVASKFAVNGFSQSLRHELVDTNVGVTVVHPGGVATNIARSALGPDMSDAEREARVEKAMRLLRMDPAHAAGQIVNGIARDADRVIVGADAWQGVWLQKWMPVRYFHVLRRMGVVD